MEFLDAEEIGGRIDGIIHDETQFSSFGIDLTVNRIGRFTGPGALDFGGSEFAEADVEWIPPKKNDPSDDYGWWGLDSAQYVVEFNETLTETSDGVALVTPLERLLRAGASHPTFQPAADEPLSTVLQVGRCGVRIKE
ncbi:MAG: dCTP deaminase, partial [Halobacteriales archaeon]|nr:dCTP deaminase [Halobacteriales archaeon]